MKKFFFANEYIYKTDEESYFPHKMFNIDSFPLAFSLNYFVFIFFYYRFQNKKSCYYFDNVDGPTDVNPQLAILYWTLLFLYILFAIFGIIDEKNIKKMYNSLLLNWEMNVLENIYNYNNRDIHLYKYLFWRNNDFKLTYNAYNYFDLYTNRNGKKCGKDNYGNYLYVRNGLDCPINNIFFSLSDEDISGYNKLALKNGYLYYTNQFTEGKIVLDLKINYDTNYFESLEQEGKKSYFKYFNVPFYDEIDSYLITERLYSIHYIGINISSISGNDVSKISKFQNKMDMYFSINTAKIVFLSTSCLSLFLFIIFFILGKEKPILAFYIIKIIIDLVYLILTIISLTINIAYVKNFMYKINSDFEREKNESSWDIILIIYYLMIISLFIIIIYSPPDNRKDIKITQIFPRKKISEKNHIPQLSSQNSLSEDE